MKLIWDKNIQKICIHKRRQKKSISGNYFSAMLNYEGAECEVWSVESGVESAVQMGSVWCGMWGLHCGVASEECEVLSVKGGAQSGKYGLQRMKCEVWSEEIVKGGECRAGNGRCVVRSVSPQCEVWSVDWRMWSVKLGVWTVEREVRSAVFEVYYWNCGVGVRTGNLKWQVWTVERGVWRAQCESIV